MKSSKDLHIKLTCLSRQLKSIHPVDVKYNAGLLMDILKSFSVSFNLDIEEILDIVENNVEGAASLQDIRDCLMTHFEKM